MESSMITGEIHQVGGSGFTSDEDAAVYLIQVGSHAALVDAGCGRHHELLVGAVRQKGIGPGGIELLLLTHCHFDHTGGAEAVKKAFQCPAVAHVRDAVFLETGNSRVTAATWYDSVMEPLAVERQLDGPESQILLGDRVITAIHTPGHTPGSLVFCMESEGRQVLFGQDVHGPLHRDFHSDRDAYYRSLERMLALEADILCEGHYGVIHGRDQVRSFIASFLS